MKNEVETEKEENDFLEENFQQKEVNVADQPFNFLLPAHEIISEISESIKWAKKLKFQIFLVNFFYVLKKDQFHLPIH